MMREMAAQVEGAGSAPGRSRRGTLTVSAALARSVVQLALLLEPPRPPERPRPPRRSDAITADFPGAACPVGSRVRFRWRGKAIEGTVAELQRARAVVAAGDDALWKVPYRLLTVVERVRERECTLADVEKLAADLLARHKAGSGLHADWGFGFDLSTSRAGVCRYDVKRIDLSVSYCLRATRAGSRTPCCTRSPTPSPATATITTTSGRRWRGPSAAPPSVATT